MRENSKKDKFYKDVYLLIGWFFLFFSIGALIENEFLICLIFGAISGFLFYSRHNKYIRNKYISKNEFTRNSLLICEFFFIISFIVNCIDGYIPGILISGILIFLLYLMLKYKYPEYERRKRYYDVNRYSKKRNRKFKRTYNRM